MAIAASQSVKHQLSSGQMIQYNLTVKQDCSTLIAGDSICVSPPGGFPVLRIVPENPKDATGSTSNEGAVSMTEDACLNATASD